MHFRFNTVLSWNQHAVVSVQRVADGAFFKTKFCYLNYYNGKKLCRSSLIIAVVIQTEHVNFMMEKATLILPRQLPLRCSTSQRETLESKFLQKPSI